MSHGETPGPGAPTASVSIGTIARQWGRIGCIGFGGPPTHIALLRQLCVDRRQWLTARDFEDGVAATNLLPGPASTQLAIFCAWRLRGPLGAVVGGLSFIGPGLFLIVPLAAVFLSANPPQWVLGAAAGAGAAVPAVALHAARGLAPASWRRSGSAGAARARWVAYAVVGGISAAVAGPYLVLVLLACGAVEAVVRRPPRPTSTSAWLPVLATHSATAAGMGALAWMAFKVGALSFGGGFVIIPLMQHDAVHTYHFLTAAQFLTAVALGQVTPGPVVQTVSVVGYAAAGVAGAAVAASVAFAPSFVFVIGGGPHFDRLRSNAGVQAFLTGAGAAAIGAIAGSAVPLGLALSHPWQGAVLVGALGWLFLLRRSVVTALLGAGLCGIVAAAAGAPVH